MKPHKRRCIVFMQRAYHLLFCWPDFGTGNFAKA